MALNFTLLSPPNLIPLTLSRQPDFNLKIAEGIRQDLPPLSVAKHTSLPLCAPTFFSLKVDHIIRSLEPSPYRPLWKITISSFPVCTISPSQTGSMFKYSPLFSTKKIPLTLKFPSSYSHISLLLAKFLERTVHHQYLCFLTSHPSHTNTFHAGSHPYSPTSFSSNVYIRRC